MVASDILQSASGEWMAGALEASGGGVNVDFDRAVVIQFIAFVLLFLLIKPLLIDPFLKVMEEREKRTDGAKTEARNMDEKAGEIFQRYESELKKVRAVAAQERERLRVEGQKLEARVLEDARQQSSRITREGKEVIAAEADKIRKELAGSTSAIATEIVGRVLGRGMP
jgi:F-type H+-transporting ATPase subunit b